MAASSSANPETRPTDTRVLRLYNMAETGDYSVTPAAFPAHTKRASSAINGIETVATVVNFTDKILITITQEGKLAHWVIPHDSTSYIQCTD